VCVRERDSWELESRLNNCLEGRRKGLKTKTEWRRVRTRRRKEGILSNFPQTYLNPKGISLVTSFLLFFMTFEPRGWRKTIRECP
jgi:hypothetical protein